MLTLAKLEPPNESRRSTPWPFAAFSASTPPAGMLVGTTALGFPIPSKGSFNGEPAPPNGPAGVEGDLAPNPDNIAVMPDAVVPGPADMDTALRDLFQDLDLRSSKSPNSNES